MITLAPQQLAPHWQVCSDCNGWFDPFVDPPMSVLDPFDANRLYGQDNTHVICINCAERRGLQQCETCNIWLPENDIIEHDAEWYCLDCAENALMAECTGCNKWMDCGELVDCYENSYCECCRERYDFYFCNGCQEYHQNTTYVECTGENYCDGCFSESYTYCSNCEEIYPHEDMRGDRCAECADDETTNWVGCAEYDEVGSPRRYGVELETSSCSGWDNYSHPAWGVKPDMTVEGMEFYSAILHGNDGLQAIDDLCGHADKQGWRVDYKCGFHLHIDLKGEDSDNLKAIAFAYHNTYDVWKHFAIPSRLRVDYCKPMKSILRDYLNCKHTDDWRRLGSNLTGRYYWVNWKAYTEHGSLEIRLLEGTLDAERVKNWVRAHTIFADWASRLGYGGVRAALWGRTPVEQFEAMREVWSNAGAYDLNEYYACDELMEVAYA